MDHILIRGVIPSPSLNGTADVATDVAFIRDEIILPLVDSGKYLVIGAHSYAGVSAAGAAQGLTVPERQQKGLKGGVLGIVYISGLCVPVGSSVVEVFEKHEVDLSRWMTIDTERGVIIPNSIDDSIRQFYNKLPAEEAKKWAQKILPQSLASITSNAAFAPWAEAAWEGRCAYLVCADDQMLPLQLQQRFVQTGNFVSNKSLPTSHSPFLDMPEEMAEVLIEFANYFLQVDSNKDRDS
ncbi:hypothetical protein B7463_g935, partial [Scytalidium lignicola]